MTYSRFEELPVWQEAIRLADGVYDMTEDTGWKGSRSLRDQIERAALSVSNNIAEGFERGTRDEFLHFLLTEGDHSHSGQHDFFCEFQHGFLLIKN